MRTVRVLAVLSLLTVALACGGSGGGTATEQAASQTIDWNGMAVPQGSGNVLMNDPSNLTISYGAGTDGAELDAQVRPVLEGAGWTETADNSSGGWTKVTFDKDGKTLQYDVMADASGASVKLVLK